MGGLTLTRRILLILPLPTSDRRKTISSFEEMEERLNDWINKSRNEIRQLPGSWGKGSASDGQCIFLTFIPMITFMNTKNARN